MAHFEAEGFLAPILLYNPSSDGDGSGNIPARQFLTQPRKITGTGSALLLIQFYVASIDVET